jgi:hypothetical protein
MMAELKIHSWFSRIKLYFTDERRSTRTGAGLMAPARKLPGEMFGIEAV